MKMKLKLILIYCILTNAHTHFVKRIFGGQSVPQHAFPNVVTVYGFGTGPSPASLFCGGIVYNEKWIVLTADCTAKIGPIFALKNIKVAAGKWNLFQLEPGEQIRKVILVLKHDDYDPSRIGKSIDLGLLKLEAALEFGESVNRFPFSTNLEYPSSTGIIVGWGSSTDFKAAIESSANTLQMLEVSVIPYGTCESAIRTRMLENEDQILENFFDEYHFCASSNTHILNGPSARDKGGPLMMQNSSGGYEVIGMISEPVGLHNLVIYINLAHFIGWINMQIDLHPDNDNGISRLN